MDRRELGAGTRVVRAARSLPPGEGEPVVPPLVQSVAFDYGSAAEQDAVFGTERPGYVYGRYGTPTTAALEVALAELDGVAAATCFVTGMAAIAAAVDACAIARGGRVVAQEDCYGQTRALFERWSRERAADISFVDTTDHAEVERALAARPTALLYAEAIANPLLRVNDVPALARLASQNGAAFAVDATFATPVLFRPAALGATMVIHSLTKYINGHGDVMGGVVGGSLELSRAMRDRTILDGGYMPPHEAWLAIRGMRTLALRVRRQSALALPAHPKGERSHAADREPVFVWWHVAAVKDRAIAHRPAELQRTANHTSHHIAVSVDVLGERVDDHSRAQRGRSEKHRGREGRVDRERRPVLARQPRERRHIVHAQERIRDGLGVEERGGSCSEGPLDLRVVRRIDEGDVRGTFARPPLKERARLPVTVLLGDDPAAAGDRARIHRRGDRGHSSDEARRRSDAVELRKCDLQRRRGRGSVAAVHIARSLVAEDGVLLGRGAVIKSDALHEWGDDRVASARGKRTSNAHDARARSQLPSVHQGSKVRRLFGGGGRLFRLFFGCCLEALRALDKISDLLTALAADPLEVTGTVLRGHSAAALLSDPTEELGPVLVGCARAALLPDLLVELRAVLLADQTATHPPGFGDSHAASCFPCHGLLLFRVTHVRAGAMPSRRPGGV